MKMKSFFRFIKVQGSLVIKDSDNRVKVHLDKNIKNMIVGYDIQEHQDVTNIPAKSFLIVSEQNILLDIIEKKIVSNIICLGIYCFKNAQDFIQAYLDMNSKKINGEMYISHLISYLLASNKYIFEAVMAESYSDWGTIKEWKQEQKRFRTYFIDVDGVILRNSGKYGKINWSNNIEYLENNVKTIKKLQDNGAQIVITTSRQESYRKDLEKLLSELGIKPYAILMGMNHSSRVIINDFAATNPYPSSIAISIPRNSDIEGYLE